MFSKYKKLCDEKQLEYNKLPMRLLQIRIQMCTPFSSIELFHLDSFLSYFSLQEILGEDFYNFRGSESELIYAPLPMLKCGEIDKWYWSCSCAIFIPDKEFVFKWKKRWEDKYDDLVKFSEKRKKRVDHKAGFFKAYSMPLPLKCANEISFFVNGNREELERLLRKVRYIGKKTSQGFGKVGKIEIDETDKDLSCWSGDSPMRAIPVSKKESGRIFNGENGRKIMRMGFRPPYWHPNNIAMCFALDIKVPLF